MLTEARSGLSTGSFDRAALELGSVAIDPAYRHALSFAITPMLPPFRKAMPSAGPLILFTDDRDVIVFSPLDHFFESLIWFEGGAIHYGIEGEIDALPAGYAHDFVMVKGRGINKTIEAWGAIVRDGKPAPDRYADLGLSTLGYWTDNGAHYYYRTEAGMNEEDTLLAVKRDADARGIPYGYVQLDSWWYEKAPGNGINPWGGTIRWEPQSQMFPEGLARFQEKLGLPLILHNRWFAPDNAYRDTHAFVSDEGPHMALPADGTLFDELMANAKQWGAITYEQDWLIPQFWGIPHLRDGVDHAARWIGDLDRAAIAHGLTTQLTMPGAAHLMDAVNRASVTTARTSIDYAPEAPKTSFWPQFHTVNMLAGALGVWPFKDNFHSAEKWGEEEALISVLSAGMVGDGDAIGMARVDVLARAARSDGVLLKPSRPATPIDAMFFDHERPYVTHTFSDHAFGRWHYVAAYHLERGDAERRAADDLNALVSYDGAKLEDMFVIPAKITDWRVDLPRDLVIEDRVVVYDWDARTALVADESFELRPTTEAFRARYVVLAPVFENGLALIGEPSKYVTVADKRFESVSVVDDGLDLSLIGAPGETIEVLAYDADDERMLPIASATLDAQGRALLNFRR